MKSKVIAIICVICMSIMLAIYFHFGLATEIEDVMTQILCIGDYGWVSQ